jgi:hypothetical protein
MQWTRAKLSMALRWLAGGSYQDIALAHCDSVSTYFRIVDETICDIGDTTTLEFRYEDEDYWKRVSMGFARGRSPQYGCAGAIDGITIKVVEPWAGTTANSPIRTAYPMHGDCDECRAGGVLCTELMLTAKQVRGTCGAKRWSAQSSQTCLAPQPIVIRHVNFMIDRQCQANKLFLTGTSLT